MSQMDMEDFEERTPDALPEIGSKRMIAPGDVPVEGTVVEHLGHNKILVEFAGGGKLIGTFGRCLLDGVPKDVWVYKKS